MDTKRAQLYVINQIAGKVQEGREKDNSFFMIVEKLPIEQIDDIDGRCSKLIRCICFARIQISAIAFYVIKSKVFEAATLMVIITNSIFLAIQDPLSNVTPSY